MSMEERYVLTLEDEDVLGSWIHRQSTPEEMARLERFLSEVRRYARRRRLRHARRARINRRGWA
jgi:hypothetical protein